jgi:2-polyprenyl-6-methoxyphenol hydroxylase-like FAD-dependent oxidoreductase
MPSPDVIFIGAGPVGLFAAIQTKLFCPNLKIRMCEKYEEYQRNHVLHVDKKSYKGSHPNPQFQAILNQLVGTVPTKVIEEKLLTFAKELGIEIQYQHILSTQELAEANPETSVIVGSDGSHSLVRKEVFGDKKIVQEDLQYTAEIKYTVRGHSRKMHLQMEFFPTLSLIQYFVSEHVGKEQEGTSQVSIRFFIDQTTFKEMQHLGISFKTPLTLLKAEEIQSPGIKKLLTSIKRWLLARDELINEQRIENSERITAINLPVYRSELFAQEHGGKTWFLVGDAALGVPYFRALNAGLLSATQLAKSIHSHFCPQPQAAATFGSYSKMSSILSKEPKTPIERYNEHLTSIATSEIFSARIKSWGVSSAQSYAQSSQAVPVSSLKLARKTRNHIKAIGDNPDKKQGRCMIM